MRRIALALVALATACSIQTVGAPTGDVTLNATFDDVQSLVAGHSVQIADVRIGSVTGIRLDGYRARVTMSLRRRIPAGTVAAVAKTSILGENYVELALPEGADLVTGPFLAQDATITRTSVEPDIEQVTEAAGPLIDALGAQDVNAVLEAASTAFAGKGGDVNRLIRQTAEVTATWAGARADIATTIDGLARLGRDLEKGSAELDRLPGTVERATERLAHGRRHIKKTIVSLTAFAKAGNLVFYPRHAERLRVLLTRLDAIAGTLLRGKDDLQAMIAELRRWIDTPPITANDQMLIYVWLRGLLNGRGDAAEAPEARNDLTLLLTPPLPGAGRVP
ncbi:hypothetical protein Acor_16660 [Acrocarpospora corrugata]|uniref:Uncharacterized protein n=1 Tax=Acrocarpospora corrugata TaxID=35763 RepID=A0A5M3VWY9_9ACTN|nr:MCE family protein [Acrocarpospora corrugata]GER99602.1 hypothetical protein Acor_16660 [Acrocarpospora corrugata]